MENELNLDTTSESAELEALNKEIEQASLSLESDFAKYMAQNTDDKLEELFFNDKEAFYMAVLSAQNEFLNTTIKPKKDRANALQKDISEKKMIGDIENAQKEFLAKYPDADIKALMDFFVNDVPPEIKADLEKLAPAQFFETLYQIYMEVNKQNEMKDNANLPQEVAGLPADTSNAELANSNLPTNRY